ncbi:hypothetical protein [Ascidiaceihabitans sp.]|uniref:hypothetical protein n=1 Tax=Ascidiaceihabitans sp. TaxID=1872644 RepID=UPI0032996EBC
MVSIFDYWGAIVGLISVVGVFIAWRQWRAPSNTTTNTADRSTNVKQKGGAGTTQNTANNSRDVDQSGA